MNGSRPEPDRDQALQRAERRAGGEHHQQRRDQPQIGGGHQHRGQHRVQPEHRADRKVDAGGDDDEGHAERDDAGLGDRANDVGDVVGRQEDDLPVARGREEDAADQHQNEADHALEADDQRERIARRRSRRGRRDFRGVGFGRVGHAASSATPVALSSNAFSSTPPGNSAMLHPCRITTILSQRPISSGNSLEATSTPRPCRVSARRRW